LLAEDAAEAQFGSKALRVSIARDVLLLLRDGQWHDVDGGSLWVADILAEGAIGLRLHFTGMDLPQGAEVVVTGSDDDLPMQGPFTKQGLLGDGAFWSGSTLGERARIEYFVPDGAAGGNPDVPFAVDSLQHVYVDIYRGGNGGGEGGPAPATTPPRASRPGTTSRTPSGGSSSPRRVSCAADSWSTPSTATSPRTT
ncbi:MAG: hypothetical protein IH804_04520, partial [Planctomycetes bacterium]|nr:hypothetical protein [Planctomycetota bacterium]